MAESERLDARKLALVLSAGGVRAMAEIGVLRAMARYGLEPDIVVGTSGGAIVAALYAAGRTPDELAALAEEWAGRGRRLVDLNWWGLVKAVFLLNLRHLSGIVKGQRLEETVERYLGGVNAFADFSRGGRRKPLFVTAVDLEDGEPVVFCDPRQVGAPADPLSGECAGYRICGRVAVSRAVRASISIPGVFVPSACLAECPERSRCQRTESARRRALGGRGRRDDGDRYVDGGVREYVPLAVAVRLARAGLVLGVNLGYAGMRREGVAQRGALEVVSQSVDIMGLDQFEETLRDELVAQARAVVINPMIYDVSTFELERMPELIRRGEQVAEECFASRGLLPGGDPAENRRRLFPPVPGALLYPSRGSEAYLRWKRQLKSGPPAPVKPDRNSCSRGNDGEGKRNSLRELFPGRS